MDLRPTGWLRALRAALEKNFQRVMKEIRETGELSVLLTRAARGHALTRDEKTRMRRQLIDVAKVIPAIAIFAAPGGVLLLIVLAKVLPFSMLPSSFTEDGDASKDQTDAEDPARTSIEAAGPSIAKK